MVVLALFRELRGEAPQLAQAAFRRADRLALFAARVAARLARVQPVLDRAREQAVGDIPEIRVVVLFCETIAQLDGLAEGIVKKLFSGIHGGPLGELVGVPFYGNRARARQVNQRCVLPEPGCDSGMHLNRRRSTAYSVISRPASVAPPPPLPPLSLAGGSPPGGWAVGLTTSETTRTSFAALVSLGALTVMVPAKVPGLEGRSATLMRRVPRGSIAPS